MGPPRLRPYVESFRKEWLIADEWLVAADTEELLLPGVTVISCLDFKDLIEPGPGGYS